MSTTSEMKRLVSEIGSSLDGLSRRLGDAKGEFEGARAKAEKVVQGSATDIEQTLVARMEEASRRAADAEKAVAKAAEVCTTYASHTL